MTDTGDWAASFMKLKEDTLSTERMVWLGLGIAAIIEATFGYQAQNTDRCDGAVVALSATIILILLMRAGEAAATPAEQRFLDPRLASCDEEGNRYWFKSSVLLVPAILIAAVLLSLAVAQICSIEMFAFQVIQWVAGALILLGVIAGTITRPICSGLKESGVA